MTDVITNVHIVEGDNLMDNNNSHLISHMVSGVHILSTSTSPSLSPRSPIFFIHGGCHGAWVWEKYQPFFTKVGYNTYALDLFDHGKSKSTSEGEFMNSSMASVVEEISILHQFQRKSNPSSLPPIIIGHSLGGLAAMKYAEKEDVSALVLICPVVSAETGVDLITIPFDDSKLFYPPYEVARQLFFSDTEESEAKRYYSLLTPESPRRVKEAFFSSISVKKQLVTCAVFVIGAETDAAMQCKNVEKLAKVYEWPFYKVDGFGHGLPLATQWGPVAGIILEFLQKL